MTDLVAKNPCSPMVKHITLEEAQLLYDLGATVWWRETGFTKWSPTTQHSYRPGMWEHDATHEWGVEEEQSDE